MSDVAFENAIKFISDSLKENPKTEIVTLIGMASARYNLNPAQEEQLYRMYYEEK